MVKYENGCVYKICCKDPNITDCYIGSTTNLIRRRANHKQRCNNENNKAFNLHVYRFIRDYGGWDNWIVLKIKDTPVDNVGELRLKEREEFEKVGATLNSCYPQRSRKEYRENNKEHISQKKKEYYEDNKEHIKEKTKEYRENNKEHLKQKKKEYRENNKEHLKQKKKEYYENNKEHLNQKIKEYYEDNKEHIKQQKKEYRENNKEHISQKKKEYYEDNKEHIKQRTKEYRQDNKEHISQKRKVKVECEICGSVVNKGYLTRHKNSKKCKKHLLEINNPFL